MEKSKKCRVCGETKLLTEFYGNGKSPGKVAYCCKECAKAKRRKHYSLHPRKPTATEKAKSRKDSKAYYQKQKAELAKYWEDYAKRKKKDV